MRRDRQPSAIFIDLHFSACFSRIFSHFVGGSTNFYSEQCNYPSCFLLKNTFGDFKKRNASKLFISIKIQALTANKLMG